MSRKNKKRTIYKKWISIYFDNCPKCGDVPEIHTDSKKDDSFYDSDDVRCSTQCGATGIFKIEADQFTGNIIWNE